MNFVAGDTITIRNEISQLIPNELVLEKFERLLADSMLVAYQEKHVAKDTLLDIMKGYWRRSGNMMDALLRAQQSYDAFCAFCANQVAEAMAEGEITDEKAGSIAAKLIGEIGKLMDIQSKEFDKAIPGFETYRVKQQIAYMKQQGWIYGAKPGGAGAGGSLVILCKSGFKGDVQRYLQAENARIREESSGISPNVYSVDRCPGLEFKDEEFAIIRPFGARLSASEAFAAGALQVFFGPGARLATAGAAFVRDYVSSLQKPASPSPKTAISRPFVLGIEAENEVGARLAQATLDAQLSGFHIDYRWVPAGNVEAAVRTDMVVPSKQVEAATPAIFSEYQAFRNRQLDLETRAAQVLLEGLLNEVQASGRVDTDAVHRYAGQLAEVLNLPAPTPYQAKWISGAAYLMNKDVVVTNLTRAFTGLEAGARVEDSARVDSFREVISAATQSGNLTQALEMIAQTYLKLVTGRLSFDAAQVKKIVKPVVILTLDDLDDYRTELDAEARTLAESTGQKIQRIKVVQDNQTAGQRRGREEISIPEGLKTLAEIKEYVQAKFGDLVGESFALVTKQGTLTSGTAKDAYLVSLDQTAKTAKGIVYAAANILIAGKDADFMMFGLLKMPDGSFIYVPMIDPRALYQMLKRQIASQKSVGAAA